MSIDPEWNPELFSTYWINYASRLTQAHFEKCLKPLGFGLPHVGVAIELEKSGSLLQRDLAIRYGVEQPTMAALLARMERDGLVSRKPHPDDKRASLVSLTPKAKVRLPKVKQRLVEQAKEATAELSEEEIRTLISLLTRITKHLT